MAYSYCINNTGTKSDSQLLKLLQKNFTMILESKQQGIHHYFDTFDGRLYRQGYHLYLFNQYIYLYQYTNNEIEEKEEYQISFSETLLLKDGTILGMIKRIIDFRALLFFATIMINKRSFRILNKADKTIVRIQIEQSKIKDKTRYKNLRSYFEIKPLKGYANQVSGILKKLPPADRADCKDDLLKRGLSELGRTPIDYSSKLSIKLTNRMSAGEATKQIYLHLLAIIRINENGIIKDIDTEFLHDFRVAIRRTRSGLGQIKGILDENVVNIAKEHFSFLGRSTNRLRDIDVYLLREQKYKSMIPEELTQYLIPFFDALKAQRKTEHQRLIKILKSVKYEQMLSDWELFLKSEDIRNQRKMGSARDLARKAIQKRNKKLLNFGQKILLAESDEILHKLRIEGKKLRYLLEFFYSLFSAEKIQYLIRKLKQLQDNLGDLNDLHIQQERLIDSVKEITVATRSKKNTVLTYGILIGKLNENQLILKKEFAKLFSNYAAPEVQKIYDEIFYVDRR